MEDFNRKNNKRPHRITTRDIRSKEVSFANLESFIPTVPGGRTPIFTFDGSTGRITINGPVTFTNQLLGIYSEIQLELLEEGSFTGNDAFEYAAPASNQPIRVALKSTDWNTDIFEFFLEMVCNGDGSDAPEGRLYNITDGAGVADTTITGTSSGDSQRVRSTTSFTLATGTKDYAFQYHRASPGVDFPAVSRAVIVIRLKGLSAL